MRGLVRDERSKNEMSDFPYFKIYDFVGRFSSKIARRLPWRSGKIVIWPYMNLKFHMERRGLQYLAKFIPWDEFNTERQCRHFINKLKIRVELIYPEHYHIIARLEAVTRMMTGFFYAARPVWLASLVGSIL